MYFNCYLSTDISNGIEISNTSNNLANSIDTWIWYVCPPCILTIRTVGNIMILMVYSGQRFTSTNMFMRALAITDLFLLYNVVFIEWLGAFDIHFAALHDFTCKIHYFNTNVLADLPAWLTASMAVQRTVSVVWPHRVVMMCTRSKTLYLIVGMAVCVLALNAHALYGFGLVRTSDNESYLCESLTDEYDSFIVVIWNWVDLLCSSFLPFVLLVISNCMLVWKMRTSTKRILLVCGQSVSWGHRKKRNAAVTRTLIVISIVFLLLTSPCTVVAISNNYYLASTNNSEFQCTFDLIHDVTLSCGTQTAL